MGDTICLKCKTVGLRAEKLCCGEVVTEFNPTEHGALLVSTSNAWIALDKWRKAAWVSHPIAKQVSEDLSRDGCYSSWIHLANFVDALIESTPPTNPIGDGDE